MIAAFCFQGRDLESCLYFFLQGVTNRKEVRLTSYIVTGEGCPIQKKSFFFLERDNDASEAD